MRARLVQCLCPERHCIAAIVAHPDSAIEGDPTYQDNAALVDSLQCAVRAMLQGDADIPGVIGKGAHIRNYCDICGADAETWTFEVRHTQDRPTWDAIKAEVEKLERAQRDTLAFLTAAGVTYHARLEAHRKANKN